MAFLDFAQLAHSNIERLKRSFARVGQFYGRKGDVVETELLRIYGSAKAQNIAFIDQPFQPRLTGRFGKTHFFRQFCHGNAPVFAQYFENAPVELIQIVCRVNLFHPFCLQYRN